METGELAAIDTPEFWRSESSCVFQNPRHILPAPSVSILPPGTLLFATSGSSGQPKWVALGKTAFLEAASAAVEQFSLDDHACWLRVLPEFHVGGLAQHARAYVAGGRVASSHGRWDARSFFELLGTSRATHTSLVPTQLHDLVSARFTSPGFLKAVFIGGGVLSANLQLDAESLGWPLILTFGMTESSSMFATEVAAPNREFRPFGGWTVRVEPPDDRLLIHGPGLLDAYWEWSDGAWSARDPKSPDGFFPTQDLARVHGKSFSWLGRADRVVKILGELVNLDTVEADLFARTDHAVCLLAVPDERRGIRLIAVSEQPISEALQAYNAQCPPFARIIDARVTHLPRSPLGKILHGQIAL